MATPVEMVGEIAGHHIGDGNQRDDGSCSHIFFPCPCNRI
jgi:hypothetical protein